jgi:5'-methylthioadenosine phosphorylase
MSVSKPFVRVIGGSGIYDIEGLTNTRWEGVSSPFGEPSDDLLFGDLEGQPMVFLPRHGRGHRLPPAGVNYRANIDALKRCGVTDVLSLSAVGSFRNELSPGTFVFVDQFIDRTIHRDKSFFGPGLVAHVSMAHPVCPRLGDALEAAAESVDVTVVRGGTYLAMDHDNVEVADIIRVLLANSARARALVRAVARRLIDRPARCPAGCDHALDHAVITASEARDPALAAKLDAVAGRVLNS